jgi:hypothetical protein
MSPQANGTAHPHPGSTAAPRCPRRIVLLRGDEQSEIEQVLEVQEDGQVSGRQLHEAVRVHAVDHPGRLIAAEWLGPLGWTRFLWCRR